MPKQSRISATLLLFVDTCASGCSSNCLFVLTQISCGVLTDVELRYLARQHCFSGYSLPSKEGRFQYFTRHHIIDWNFHPSFPRPRPNKWWVELDRANAPCQSFKEFTPFARDDNNVPVFREMG